jgi:anti-sigma factor RsiW
MARQPAERLAWFIGLFRQNQILRDYADDALPPAERADVERHLAGCAECRALVDDMREIRRAARSLEPRDPPVRAWMRIERAIQLDAANRRERGGAQPGAAIARRKGSRASG